jgi:hypothetical protein
VRARPCVAPTPVRRTRIPRQMYNWRGSFFIKHQL